MIIYKIQNKINGKIYIGQTKNDVSQRVAGHIKGDSYVGRALRKYGLESFDISVIDHADTKEVLDEKEKYWIKALDCQSPSGYNLVGGGGGCLTPSEETLKKMSNSQKGNKHLLGYHHLEESKAQTSKKLKGRVSPMKGKPHPSKGTKMDEEKKKNLRHPKSEQGRRNMKAAAKESYAEGRSHFSKINKKGHNKGYTPWNKGLTKETDERVNKMYSNHNNKKQEGGLTRGNL